MCVSVFVLEREKTFRNGLFIDAKCENLCAQIQRAITFVASTAALSFIHSQRVSITLEQLPRIAPVHLYTHIQQHLSRATRCCR